MNDVICSYREKNGALRSTMLLRGYILFPIKLLKIAAKKIDVSTKMN